jgi:hypothetical protein
LSQSWRELQSGALNAQPVFDAQRSPSLWYPVVQLHTDALSISWPAWQYFGFVAEQLP